MADSPFAARVGDPVQHTDMLGGALAGIAVGLVIGAMVAATILSGGLALGPCLLAISAVCTGITAGFTAGGLLGKLGHSTTGAIAAGAHTVFIGPGVPAAARIEDPIHCKSPMSTVIGATLLGSVLLPGIGGMLGGAIAAAHSGHADAVVGEGARDVLTEGKPQARVGDKTSCGGSIADGCHTVLVFGPKAALPENEGEIPKWLDDTIWWVDLVGVVTGFAAPWGVIRGASRIDKILTGADLAMYVTEKGLHYTGHDEAAENLGYARTLLEVAMLGKGFHDAHAENVERAAQAAERAAAEREAAERAAQAAQRPALPAPPERLALPAPPQRLALPAPPQRLALPAPPERLALPAPPEPKLLPAPSGGG